MEEKPNAPSNASAGLIQKGQTQALDQVSNLVTNYNSSNEANRPATVEAFKNHLFKLDRGVVKKMFDTASALRNKPDLNFIIPELPGIYIPKKIFTEDLNVPAKAFMVDYDRKNYLDLQVRSQAEAATKSEGSSTKLDAAKAAVLGTGLGTIGSTLGGMVGIRPDSGRRSKTQSGKTEDASSTPQRKTRSTQAPLHAPEISNVPIAAPSAGSAAPVAAPQATKSAAAPSVQLTAEGEIKNQAETQIPNIPPPPPPATSGGKGAPQTAQVEVQGEDKVKAPTEIKVTMPTTGSQPISLTKELSVQAPMPDTTPPPISIAEPAYEKPRRSRVGTYGRQPAALSGAPATPTPQKIVGVKPGRSQPARVPVLPARRGPTGAEVTRPGTRQATELGQAPTAGGRGQAQTAGQELATPSAPTEQPAAASVALGGARGTSSSSTTKRPSSHVPIIPRTRRDDGTTGTMGRPERGSYKSVGPQEIKPPISRAMDLHAAQSQAWRGREIEYGEDGSLSAGEGLELSESGLESELAEGPENQPVLPMQIERRGGYYKEGERGPGSMPIEEEAEDEMIGGGTPESELEKLMSFQSRQRQTSMAGEQLTGAPSARTRGVKPEPPSTRQLASQSAGQRGTAGKSGGPGKMDEIGMALKLLSSQVSSKLQADQRLKQYEDFKEKIESLKRGKQAFKNLLDVGEIGAGESGMTILTLWAEWNIDLINKHIAGGKIPFFEQKPSTGSLPLEKTISQVKDGITILADILIPVSLIATLIIPLTMTALIIISFFGVFLKLADLFGVKLI